MIRKTLRSPETLIFALVALIIWFIITFNQFSLPLPLPGIESEQLRGPATPSQVNGQLEHIFRWRRILIANVQIDSPSLKNTYLISDKFGTAWTPIENIPADAESYFDHPLSYPKVLCVDYADNICFRTTGQQSIEQSHDGGSTWEAAWEVQIDSSQDVGVPELINVDQTFFNFKIQDFEIDYTEEGFIIVVTTAQDGILYRTPRGDWHQIGIYKFVPSFLINFSQG